MTRHYEIIMHYPKDTLQSNICAGCIFDMSETPGSRGCMTNETFDCSADKGHPDYNQNTAPPVVHLIHAITGQQVDPGEVVEHAKRIHNPPDTGG